MSADLADFQGPNPHRSVKKLTEAEKLELVDAIIDRDAQLWKDRARDYCDFGYYFRFINGGVALTERQR